MENRTPLTVQAAPEIEGVEGIVVATVCDCTTLYAKILSRTIGALVEFNLWPRLRKRLLDHYHALFAVGRYTERYVQKNVTTTVGRTQIAKALTNQIASVAEIAVNKSALGTGTTAPNVADTQLQTETFRKNIASQTNASNVAYNVAFYLAGDTSGTFYEHAIFINGTGTANSGTILSRVLLNSPTGVTKSSSQTLTVEHQHTINNA